MNQYIDYLGRKATDRITGMEGVITSVAFDLFGCVQFILTPPAKNGRYGEPYWLDAKRLDIKREKRVMEPPAFGVMKAGSEGGAERKPVPRA